MERERGYVLLYFTGLWDQALGMGIASGYHGEIYTYSAPMANSIYTEFVMTIFDISVRETSARL